MLTAPLNASLRVVETTSKGLLGLINKGGWTKAEESGHGEGGNYLVKTVMASSPAMQLWLHWRYF